MLFRSQAAQRFLERRRESPVSPLNPAAIAGQQAIADTFAKEGVLPHEIKVADAVWHADR